NRVATPGLYTLSLHDALPIWLQKVRRLEPAVRERLGAVHRERLRRRDACFRGFRRKQVLAAQTPDDLRVRRKRHVGALEHLVPVDRKSTRLNSSHRTISYAVF